ncbi:hypothetical protein FS749_016408 [Ceratobasidium sp. UAMH 11750]|nr:hypothetical protein FS749_016408 [Ceratobasidium sp. UAMH 11750]
MTSLEPGGIPVRMEDVVRTLNNIVDDIGRMYADTPDSSMEDVLHLNQGLPTRSGGSASSLRMPAPRVQDLDLDSDSSSLGSWSTSPNPSSASSGFTSPATSPTASEFLVGRDEGTSPNQEDVGHPVIQAMGSSDVQLHTDQSDQSGMSLASANHPSFSPPATLFPSSLAGSFEFGPSSSSSQCSGHSSSCLPELCFPSEERSDSNATYEALHFANARFIDGSESPQTSSVEQVPGISPSHLTIAPPGLPPRPAPAYTGACDPPADISSLCSPTLPPTPNPGQPQRWASRRPDQAEGQEAATYLVRQRQLARTTIIHATSLPEPKNLPAYRPRAHHLYSYPHTGSPRSRTGAHSRRVNVAPRVLEMSWWNPWRKGGVIDRATVLADNRRRLRMLEDALQEELALEAANEAEGQLTEGAKGEDANVPNGQAESEVHNTGAQEPENGEMPLASQETKDAEQGGSDTAQERAQDEALLMATLVASLALDSCLNLGSIDNTSACPGKSTGQDLDTMQVYVEDGVLVTPPGEQTATTPDDVSKDAISPHFPVSTKDAAITQSDEWSSKYAPRCKSPLRQSFVAPPPIARLRIPSVHEVGAGALSPGRMWRKFTSMMF